MRTIKHRKAPTNFFFNYSPGAELYDFGSVLTSHVMPFIMFGRWTDNGSALIAAGVGDAGGCSLHLQQDGR